MTNIRCAVVEGSHHCEAACWNLQDYILGGEIPLKQFPQSLPSSCTLFKELSTEVIYCAHDGMKIESSVLDYLKAYSKKVAAQKELVVSQSWQLFFSEIAKDINCNSALAQILYTTQEEFYQEELTNRELSNPSVRSNQIKKHLHQILTNAIFTYHLCKNLLDLCKTNKPSPETWITGANKWLSLASEPLQHVSKHCFFFL